MDIIDNSHSEKNERLCYKGYYGSCEYSEEDSVFHGRVLEIQKLISYEGDNVESLTDDFTKAIDEYLDFCTKNSIQPEWPHRTPNAETLAALEEVEEMTRNPCLYKSYKSVVELFADLDSDDTKA